jgi:ketosteroid isomerase-like protein
VSRENVEIVRRGFDAFNRGADFDRWVSEFVDPEIEYHTSVEDPDAAIHRGHEGYRRYVEQWQESFDDFHADVEEYIAVGDDRVFTWVRWTGLGRGSGVRADWHLAMIYTLRNGKVVRGDEYFDRAEALKAVGLEE